MHHCQEFLVVFKKDFFARITVKNNDIKFLVRLAIFELYIKYHFYIFYSGSKNKGYTISN